MSALKTADSASAATTDAVDLQGSVRVSTSDLQCTGSGPPKFMRGLLFLDTRTPEDAGVLRGGGGDGCGHGGFANARSRCLAFPV